MSENIFTEIYNKILSLFGQTEEKEESKNVAVNRLRVVLMQDRTNLTPEILQRMRAELVELLSKYLEMDKDALELNLEQDGEQMALMLSIPVIRAKDEDEIEAAIKEQENSEKEESEDEEKTSDEPCEDENDSESENNEESDKEIDNNDSEEIENSSAETEEEEEEEEENSEYIVEESEDETTDSEAKDKN